MEKQSQNPMAVEPVPRLMARIGTNALLARLPRRRAVCRTAGGAVLAFRHDA